MSGVFKAVDSADFFVQAQDATAPLIATLTATNGGTSPVSADITNRLHRGVALYVTVASLTVNTATLAFNINGKNAVDGTYFPVARVSLDGLTNGSNGSFGIAISPGAPFNNPSGNLPGLNAGPGILPAVFQVQASLTITTSASQSGTLAYAVRGMSRTV